MLKKQMFSFENESPPCPFEDGAEFFDRFYRACNDRSLESAQEDEIERVYFLKISDFSQFDTAIRTENHEQWEYRIIDKEGKPLGTERSRSIDNGARYELTIKSYRKDGAGSVETTLDSTKEMHEVISNLADRVLTKTRYVIPTGTMVTVLNPQGDEVEKELLWEVDAFLMGDGSFYPWVKVDLEVPSEDIQAPALPFKSDEVINVSYDANPTDEQRRTVDSIFDSVKRTK